MDAVRALPPAQAASSRRVRGGSEGGAAEGEGGGGGSRPKMAHARRWLTPEDGSRPKVCGQVHADLETLEGFIRARAEQGGARVLPDRCIEAADASMVRPRA